MIMRKLDEKFVAELKEGGLFRPIIDTVINDASLDFQIRKGYINIYFKGNSILKLDESGKFEINEKFLDETGLLKSNFSTSSDVNDYIKTIPVIKNRVIEVKSHRPTLEIEYEQLLIRSNNLNINVNSEFLLTDRQYTDNCYKVRFDLSGFFWGSKGRWKNQTVPLAFIEVKYSLNPDIATIDEQIDNYYEAVKSNISDIAEETEYLRNIKIDLGLINQPKERLDAFKTLKISNRIEDAKFIIALIDFNPNSILFDIGKLKALSFNSQIEIFKCGFAIWSDYLKKL